MRVSYHCTSMLNQTFNPHMFKVSSNNFFQISSLLGYLHCYINQNSSRLHLKYEYDLTYKAVYAINHMKHRQIFFALFAVERIITFYFQYHFIDFTKTNSSFISLESLQWILAWNWFDAFPCTKYKFQKIWLKTP